MISVVTTLYYSEKYIDDFYARIESSVKEITADYEIIFVNDGSPDQSLQKALNLKKSDNRIKVIDLSRNFGHHNAIKAGLDYAKGDHVFLIDSDLEEEPELISEFYEKLKEKNAEVVYGVQKNRAGGFLNIAFGHIFYLIFRWLCDFNYVKNVMTIRSMTRKYVDSIINFKENQLEIYGLFFLAGFKQEKIMLSRVYKGSTTYTFNKSIGVALNSIISFSKKPLELIFLIGLITSIFSILYVLYIRSVYGVEVEGWISILLSIWFLGGVIISCLGVLGLYFSKIFLEVKRRPTYIVDNIYE